METATADVEKEQVGRKTFDQIPILNEVRKYIHVLPSGRRLKIIADNEMELKRALAALQS